MDPMKKTATIFNIEIIFYGMITALFASLFIYLSYFGIENKLLNSIFALTAFYLVLINPKKSLFWTGFFIGVFWFWWVCKSFYYYDLKWMMPFIVLGLGLAYGLFFYLIAFIDKLYFRFIMLFGISFFAPFGFNWFKPELLLVQSYFDVSKLSYILILLSLVLIIKRYYKLSIIPLLFILDFNTTTNYNPPISIYMPNINIAQEQKWLKNNRDSIIDQNNHHIKYAIKEGFDLVILPETAYPVILNKNEKLLYQLKEYSKKISIVTGALYVNGSQYNNSSYHFEDGKVNIAHKVVLVPFGEAVPLPKKIRDFINDTFYNGAKDYSTALYPTDFNIKGVQFRNAICYEATRDELFANSPEFMIAISNNAWFTPSIEPTLQALLMRYYSKKYSTTIFNVANGSKNIVIY